jgi:hypothetical protein
MSVIQTKDGGYAVAGRTASYGAGKDDIWLVKTTSTGSEQWNSTLGGPGNDVGLQLLETGDGYVITGRTELNGTVKKAFLLRTDSKGKMLWENVYGEDCSSLSMLQDKDGGFVLAGYIDSNYSSNDSGRNAWLAKTDAAGNLQWSRSLGGKGQDMASSVALGSDGGYTIAGITNSLGAGSEDAWLVKMKIDNATFAKANIDAALMGVSKAMPRNGSHAGKG